MSIRTSSNGKARTRDGTEIVYGVSGETDSAYRLVLVHSLAMQRDFWDGVLGHLSPKIAAIAIDARGHGRSGKPAGPYTVEQFADDIVDVMTHVGWKSAAVAGASMGGCVALAFGIRHAARCDGLGLIDTTAWYGADAPKAWAERAEAAGAKGLGALIEFQLTRWFGDRFRAENPAAMKHATDVFLANDVAAYQATCGMLGAADLRSGLASIKAPTRIVVGDEDYATPIAMSEALRAGIAGSTMLVLPKARHLTPIEEPAVVAAELGKLF